ncbi:MAG: hypothetical protein WC785_08860 [Tatlockia sp.]|jgi:hypothetical protein
MAKNLLTTDQSTIIKSLNKLLAVSNKLQSEEIPHIGELSDDPHLILWHISYLLHKLEELDSNVITSDEKTQYLEALDLLAYYLIKYNKVNPVGGLRPPYNWDDKIVYYKKDALRYLKFSNPGEIYLYNYVQSEGGRPTNSLGSAIAIALTAAIATAFISAFTALVLPIVFVPGIVAAASVGTFFVTLLASLYISQVAAASNTKRLANKQQGSLPATCKAIPNAQKNKQLINATLETDQKVHIKAGAYLFFREETTDSKPSETANKSITMD